MTRFSETTPGAVCEGDCGCMFCVFRRGHENGQLLVTRMHCAEQRHATTASVEVHQSEGQLSTALTHDLQSVGDCSCDENDGAGARQSFSQQPIEVEIAGVEKNLW